MSPYVGCPECGEKIASVSPDTVRRAKSPKHLLDILVKRKKISAYGRCKCGGTFYTPRAGFLCMKAPRALRKSED